MATAPLKVRIRRDVDVPAVNNLAYNTVHVGDVMDLCGRVASASAQCVIADPPYPSEGVVLDEAYLTWADSWIAECLRILREDGTMFLYGDSEHLAQLMVRLPASVNRRWLVWHFINKNTINKSFWQHSHMSILAIWKRTKVFNTDAVREPYGDNYSKYAAGKVRKGTQGFFADGAKQTTYNAHEKGALPRDVMRIPALAGGAGHKERVAHPDQKPLALARRLIESCMQTNGIVFVPFAGSGTECVAAAALKLPFVGIEKEAGYVRMAEIRLAMPTEEDATNTVELT